MAYNVTWSPEALDDVDEIAAFLARSSRRYAATVVDKIFQATRNLDTFPFAGRVVPEVGENLIRERLVMEYRLIYKIDGSDVMVLAVIHGRRLFPFEVE